MPSSILTSATSNASPSEHLGEHGGSRGTGLVMSSIITGAEITLATCLLNVEEELARLEKSGQMAKERYGRWKPSNGPSVAGTGQKSSKERDKRSRLPSEILLRLSHVLMR